MAMVLSVLMRFTIFMVSFVKRVGGGSIDKVSSALRGVPIESINISNRI